MTRSVIFILTSLICLFAYADSIPVSAWKNPGFRIGAEVSGAYVAGNETYFRGENPFGKSVNASFAAALRGAFTFNPDSEKGMAYRGLYQGLGIEARTYFAESLLGTPVSLYAFQGAPVFSFNPCLSLDYEWQFGAAFGWKHYGPNADGDIVNTAVSTPVTAHMAIGLKLKYTLNPSFKLYAGLHATHFSNGNTSFPNGGVNCLGMTIGMEYCLGNRREAAPADPEVIHNADKQKMFYDLTLFGGWRIRGLTIDGDAYLCSGKFGVAGVQFAALRKLNRWFSAGASLDMMYDESSGLAKYKADEYYDELKFYRPPFGKQLSVGLSAHAQLNAPIFTVDVGLGYDFLKPHGDMRFYQSLTLKTFVTDWLYINTGYRLGKFQDPQNLMLGFGFRF